MKLRPDPGLSSPVWGGVSVPVMTKLQTAIRKRKTFPKNSSRNAHPCRSARQKKFQPPLEGKTHKR